MLLPPKPLKLWRMEMATNLTSSTHSGLTSSQILTSESKMSCKKCMSGALVGYTEYFVFCCFFSNQVHEHQWWMGDSREAAFQRFCECIVFVIKVMLVYFKLKFYIFPCMRKLYWRAHFSSPCREICATGLRTQTVGISTVWSTRQESGRQFSITMLKTQSQLKRERWVVMGRLVWCYSLQVHTTYDNRACLCSVGPRRTCAGLLRARTWQPSINVALPYGVARSSSRSRGSATWACHSSTSHRARGERLSALTG